jgi:hypothetical protein
VLAARRVLADPPLDPIIAKTLEAGVRGQIRQA